MTAFRRVVSGKNALRQALCDIFLMVILFLFYFCDTHSMFEKSYLQRIAVV